MVNLRLLAAFLLTAWMAAATSAVPGTISWQAYLTDSAGVAIDDTVSIEFRIYDAESDGTLLWSSTRSVAVRNGLLRTELGSEVPFPAGLFARPLWLSLVVHPDAVELQPRRALAAVPAAFSAATAETAATATDVDCPGCVDAGDSAPGAVPAAAMCYTRWGAWGCAGGFDEVTRGLIGGLESFSGSAGDGRDHLLCVNSGAVVQSTFTGYNRLMRGDAEGDGMDRVPPRCSTCCTGGCFTAFGSNSCPSSYTRTVSGRLGGVEAYTSGANADAVCVDVTAPAQQSWSVGYSTRLFRFRDVSTNQNGMDAISNVCAVCCKTE